MRLLNSGTLLAVLFSCQSLAEASSFWVRKTSPKPVEVLEPYRKSQTLQNRLDLSILDLTEKLADPASPPLLVKELRESCKRFLRSMQADLEHPTGPIVMVEVVAKNISLLQGLQGSLENTLHYQRVSAIFRDSIENLVETYSKTLFLTMEELANLPTLIGRWDEDSLKNLFEHHLAVFEMVCLTYKGNRSCDSDNVMRPLRADTLRHLRFRVHSLNGLNKVFGDYIRENCSPADQHCRQVILAIENFRPRLNELIFRLSADYPYILGGIEDRSDSSSRYDGACDSSSHESELGDPNLQKRDTVQPGQLTPSISSFSTLHYVSSADEPLSCTRQSDEMLDIIARRVVLSYFCDLNQVLVEMIKFGRIEIVQWVLRLKQSGEYSAPGVSSVDFTKVLSTAIEVKQTDIVTWLLRPTEDGKYVLPGFKVTEDMLTIADQPPEIKSLLEKRLLQQRKGIIKLP